MQPFGSLVQRRMTMKTTHLILIGILFVGSSNAAPITHEVPVKLGPKRFLDGDVVRIDSVTSTSPSLEPGDTVTVTGMYRLDSHEEATLGLYLTQTEGDGSEEMDPSQTVIAKKGWHEFTTVITVKHRGLLHLTFYERESGRPLGGVYFGTLEQIDGGHGISVDHYPTKR